MSTDQRIGIIGSGAMGGAIIAGLIQNQVVPPNNIIASDPRPDRGQELTEQFDIHFTEDNSEVCSAADTLILAIKPQVLPQLISEIGDHTADLDLIVSIIAGAKIGALAKGLDNPAIVRTIPNTPAQIGEGMTAWTATSAVTDQQKDFVGTLLDGLGKHLYVHDEKYIDMATAINGSGPAYVFLIMEAMIDTGVHLGFSRSEAEQLVTQTLRGSLLYAESSDRHPAQLKNQVTSPGGTTAAGLAEMEKLGLRNAISEGIWAAYLRSVELGKS